MHFHARSTRGNRTYYHDPHIWHETSLVLYLGDTDSDYPTDILAFSFIIYLVVRFNINEVPIPSLLRTIAQDATYYFLIVFTSHLVLMFFILFANVRISS